MARPRKVVPDYRYHVSGQAVVTFNQKNFYLGPHNTPESQAKYRKLLAEYIATGETPRDDAHQGEVQIKIADVVAEAREWINKKFASNPGHLNHFQNICTTLADEYGDTPASEFGPRKLEALRDLFVASGNCRKYVNAQIRYVVRVFKYAVSRELVDPIILVKLDSLEPLKYGQTTARESTPVKPANIEDVRKTAAKLSPTLKAMIRIQAATGMRPSELVSMRPMDIDRTGDAWVYRPAKHKTLHRGKTKAVPIVGDAKEALLPFLKRKEDEFCFSPAESMEWYRQRRADARVTPLSCGNKKGSNRKTKPERVPGKAYSKDSYRRAIQRAAEAAKVPHWFPYQLRHLAGTVVREALGVEAAQALLGHSRASMTEHYAKLSEAKAVEAAQVAPKL